MVGFNYTYTDPENIYASLTRIIDFSPLQYTIIGIASILLIVLIYYMIPIIHITMKYLKEENEKRKKRNLLKQISMQREIEEEIEAEIAHSEK
ncbi:MAG: hypothetical protein H6767_08355 [Candidatus Peribacteria bacterium]|nr:MAG: hypothetical protein H6767_08355 [Candidatus Peribacteria bacterium]